MYKKIAYLAALGALIMVGAGCGKKAVPPAAAPEMPAAVAPVPAGDSVDSTVDELFRQADSESSQLQDEAGDTSELNSADPEIREFTESSYDIE